MPQDQIVACNPWIARVRSARTDLWPRRSRSPCYQCGLRFDSVPCLVPVGRRASDNCLYLYGIFCCWNCAKLFAATSIPFYKDTTSLALLAFVTCHSPRNQVRPVAISTARKNYVIRDYAVIRRFVKHQYMICQDVTPLVMRRLPASNQAVDVEEVLLDPLVVELEVNTTNILSY